MTETTEIGWGSSFPFLYHPTPAAYKVGVTFKLMLGK